MRALRETELASEWRLLQNQFDSYEKYSLVIKLASVLLVGAAYIAGALGGFLLVLVAILWLLDAIWKTFQARIDARLLQLETYLQKAQRREAEPEDDADTLESLAYQYNRVYQRDRASLAGLVLEYSRQALKPTVAFPYVALLIVLMARLI